LALVAIAALSDLSEGSAIRVERDACAELLAEFDSCKTKAYDDYKAAFEAGDDGRPDWMARKSCNYMTAAVEDCGNTLVGECNSEEDVNEMKDQQLKGILHQLQTSVEEWDSEKCPAIKSHIERMKGDTADEEETPDEDTADEEPAPEEESGAQEAEPNAEPESDPEADDEEETADEDTADEEPAPEEESGAQESESDAEPEAEPETDPEADPEAGDESGDAEDASEDEDEDEDESGAVTTTASLSVVMALYLACYA